jgi:3'-5' exoribonuclease
MTLEELQQAAAGGGGEFSVLAQIERLKEGRTQSDRPFFDLELADATGRVKLKIWGDTPAFDFLSTVRSGEAICLSGKFFTNDYGLNVSGPAARVLEAGEREALFAGSEEMRRVLEADWALLLESCGEMTEIRLRRVCLLALEKFEKKWRRAAAARAHHHARRGGLLQHTAQMMRCARALAPLYGEVHGDLVRAGVLFHDIGKLWENDVVEEGFASPYSRTGEMLGHISIGIELANQLWKEARDAHPDDYAAPGSDLVRDHLLHLIASHHGQKEYGAPVTPRTPEAWMLHQIDNLDAKVEMLRCAYREKEELAPGVFEPRRPLEGTPILPLKEALARAGG